MLFQVILLALLIIICTVNFFSNKPFRYVNLARQIQGPPLWELITVHAKHLLSDDCLHQLCTLSAKYEYKPWGLWNGSCLLVFVNDPDTVEKVFKSKHLVNKYEGLYDKVCEFLGRGSLVTNGLKWKRHRNVTTPAFHKDIVEAQLDVINEEAIELVKILKATQNKSEFEINKVIGERVVQTAIRSLGERDLFVKNLPDFYWALTQGNSIIQMKAMNPIYYYFVYLFQKKNRDNVARVHNIIEECREIISHAKDRIMRRFSVEGNIPRLPIEFLLAANSRKKSDYLTVNEFLDETMTIIAAASDTTSTAIFAALLLLALNPDVQNTLVKEIETVFDRNDNRHVTSEDLNQLEYLDMVIKETLRLFPPASLLLRKVGGEYDLNGTIVPKSSVVAVNVMSLHRNPQVYKDPLKFDPDRFSPSNVQTRHPYGYIPFSSGARNCVGKRHAILVMKTFLCTLLRNNRILPGNTLKSFDDIKTKICFTMRLCGASVKLIPVVGDQ